MIVPMKKVLLLATARDRETALEALRDLGVMQIELAERQSADTQRTAERSEALTRLLAACSQFIPDDGAVPAGPASKLTGEEAEKRLAAVLEKRAALAAELDAVRVRRKNLAVLGDFDRELLDRLNASGIRVIPCLGSAEEFAAACKLPDVQCELLRVDGGMRLFAALAYGEADETKLPVFKLAPEDDPHRLKRREAAILAELEESERRLSALRPELPKLRRRAAELAAELEFRRVGDAVGEHGEIVSLSGFVPEPELEKLRECARKEGWGLCVNDPAPDERVPVLLRRGNAFTGMVKPLFDFLGIIPGYREIDVSGGVLFFFTIFYAIIIGDAGYGLLFLAGSLLLAWKFRADPGKRQLVRLSLLLSSATVAWGALSGLWFGVQKGGIRLLTDPAVKDANTQAFCFILAVAQLSLGHLWRAIHDRSWRNVLSNLGWMLIIWGNFFLALRIIVFPGDFPKCMYVLYGAGLALVLAFSVRWRDPAAVFQFPFDVIGSFTDVLSYIRLFAVGMAGACISATFNNMSLDIAKASPYFIVFGILGLCIGHALNLALCVMGVLVHAVRLNTLEFSNHSGLTWSGAAFKPFAKPNLDQEDQK